MTCCIVDQGQIAAKYLGSILVKVKSSTGCSGRNFDVNTLDASSQDFWESSVLPVMISKKHHWYSSTSTVSFQISPPSVLDQIYVWRRINDSLLASKLQNTYEFKVEIALANGLRMSAPAKISDGFVSEYLALLPLGAQTLPCSTVHITTTLYSHGSSPLQLRAFSFSFCDPLHPQAHAGDGSGDNGPAPAHPSPALAAQAERLLLDPDFADVAFEVQGRTLRAHRAVLAADRHRAEIGETEKERVCERASERASERE